jgi:15,16-dihydrobiliverdin:ferredoxin oxidoreductase
MLPQHLLILLPVVGAFVASPSPRSFVGRGSTSLPQLDYTKGSQMDMGTFTLDPIARFDVEHTLERSFRKEIEHNLRTAEESHGMPWKSSIDPKVEGDLLYMPFWDWQMSFLEENLTNLQVLPCSNGKTDFSYNANEKKNARIVNLCASSDEYRKIRMTYYDAGDNTQVFNAVLYPDPKYNLPVLGIDLLAFNRKKYLAIVDFQPIHEDEEDHASTFEHILKPIKEKYDNLKGRMSSKFYDETKFFSQQMLFARFEDDKIIDKELFPAFKKYVETHLDLIRNTKASSEDSSMVLKRQKEYDTYSAERDPATGLFTAMFGAEWAQDFVHDFLFSMSDRPDGPPPAPFMMGGPPPQGNHATRRP